MNMETLETDRSFERELAPGGKTLSTLQYNDERLNRYDREVAVEDMEEKEGEVGFFAMLAKRGIPFDKIHFLPDVERILFVEIPLEEGKIDTQEEIEAEISKWNPNATFVGYGTHIHNVGFTNVQNVADRTNKHGMGEYAKVFIPVAVPYDY